MTPTSQLPAPQSVLTSAKTVSDADPSVDRRTRVADEREKVYTASLASSSALQPMAEPK